MLFFITVTKCGEAHFSTITTDKPFEPPTNACTVFSISETDEKRFFQILTIKARTKAREMQIPWVNGLD
ncbi:MAG: hypothetical protein WCW31_05500 [Patescibacteria group bacterium]|jgi:hypothetical protein